MQFPLKGKRVFIFLGILAACGAGCASSRKSARHREALEQYNLGVGLYMNGQAEEAIEKYRSALELDPDFAYGHRSLGVVLREQGRWKEAIEEFREAMRADPGYNADMHMEIGRICQDQGLLDEALIEYQEAVRLRFLFPDGHERLGDVYGTKGMIKEAIEAYEQSLALGPEKEARERIKEKLDELKKVQ